ncbi:MAG: hypothetical protein JWL77_3849 [Chthonomonadaceae bacterium]|nr:hypothetical protein [Chthonomonadaceae bacterium]
MNLRKCVGERIVTLACLALIGSAIICMAARSDAQAVATATARVQYRNVSSAYTLGTRTFTDTGSYDVAWIDSNPGLTASVTLGQTPTYKTGTVTIKQYFAVQPGQEGASLSFDVALQASASIGDNSQAATADAKHEPSIAADGLDCFAAAVDVNTPGANLQVDHVGPYNVSPTFYDTCTCTVTVWEPGIQGAGGVGGCGVSHSKTLKRKTRGMVMPKSRLAL